MITKAIVVIETWEGVAGKEDIEALSGSRLIVNGPTGLSGMAGVMRRWAAGVWGLHDRCCWTNPGKGGDELGFYVASQKDGRQRFLRLVVGYCSNQGMAIVGSIGGLKDPTSRVLGRLARGDG